MVQEFESFMEGHGYKIVVSDYYVFINKFGNVDFIIFLVYVDDTLIVVQDNSQDFKLEDEFNQIICYEGFRLGETNLGHVIMCDREVKKLWLS